MPEETQPKDKVIMCYVNSDGPNEEATKLLNDALAQGYRVIDVISTPTASVSASVVVTTVLSQIPKSVVGPHFYKSSK